jgi:RNA-directed DNA polymerase
MVNPEKGAKFKEQIDRIKEKYGRKKKATVPNVSQPLLSRSDIVAQIDTKLKEVGCSTSVTQMYLKKIYKKQSLKQLTETELLELLRDLTSSPSENSGVPQVNFVKRWKALITKIRISYHSNRPDIFF